MVSLSNEAALAPETSSATAKTVIRKSGMNLVAVSLFWREKMFLGFILEKRPAFSSFLPT